MKCLYMYMNFLYEMFVYVSFIRNVCIRFSYMKCLNMYIANEMFVYVSFISRGESKKGLSVYK